MDISVAGVSGGRTSDEKVPRAWVVLSDEGTNLGAEKTLKTLQQWVEKNLSRYKWLRGGLEVVDEVWLLYYVAQCALINPSLDTQTSNWEGSAPCLTGPL